MKFKSTKQRKAVMAKLKSKYGSQFIGASKYRTSAELAKRKYISKYFIPDVTKVPVIKEEKGMYVILKRSGGK